MSANSCAVEYPALSLANRRRSWGESRAILRIVIAPAKPATFTKLHYGLTYGISYRNSVNMETFTDVLDAFPEGALVEDRVADAGKLAVWRHRDTIPPLEFPAVVESARKRRIKGITLDLLHGLLTNKKGRAA